MSYLRSLKNQYMRRKINTALVVCTKIKSPLCVLCTYLNYGMVEMGSESRHDEYCLYIADGRMLIDDRSWRASGGAAAECLGCDCAGIEMLRPCFGKMGKKRSEGHEVQTQQHWTQFAWSAGKDPQHFEPVLAGNQISPCSSSIWPLCLFANFIGLYL